MTITITFELSNAGTCTENDIRFSNQIRAPNLSVHTGTEIRFIQSSANTATFIVYTDNTSYIPSNYYLEVTAKAGLTSITYIETITISGPLCGTVTVPILEWKSTPLLPFAITYSVGSSENKEIVLDPAIYIDIINPGSPACSIGDIILTIYNVLTFSGDSSIADSVLSQISASTFKLNWEQTSNQIVDTLVEINFQFGTKHNPGFFLRDLTVFIRSCSGAPIDTVKLSAEL